MDRFAVGFLSRSQYENRRTACHCDGNSLLRSLATWLFGMSGAQAFSVLSLFKYSACLFCGFGMIWIHTWYLSICAMDVSYPYDVWMREIARHGESFDRCAMLCFGSVDLGLSQGLQAATEASRGVGGLGVTCPDWRWGLMRTLPKIHIAPYRIISYRYSFSSPYVAE